MFSKLAYCCNLACLYLSLVVFILSHGIPCISFPFLTSIGVVSSVASQVYKHKTTQVSLKPMLLAAYSTKPRNRANVGTKLNKNFPNKVNFCVELDKCISAKLTSHIICVKSRHRLPIHELSDKK